MRIAAVVMLAVLTISSAMPARAFEAITAEQIAGITFEDCEDDDGVVLPVAANLDDMQGEELERFKALTAKIDASEFATEKDVGQKVRNMLGIAGIADLGRSEFERQIAYHVFEKLKADVPKEQLKKACAWVALYPTFGKTVLTAPDLGFDLTIDDEAARERSKMYAKKLLGRLVGQLPVAK